MFRSCQVNMNILLLSLITGALIRKSQEGPGGARRSPEEPEGARRRRKHERIWRWIQPGETDELTATRKVVAAWQRVLGPRRSVDSVAWFHRKKPTSLRASAEQSWVTVADSFKIPRHSFAILVRHSFSFSKSFFNFSFWFFFRVRLIDL